MMTPPLSICARPLLTPNVPLGPWADEAGAAAAGAAREMPLDAAAPLPLVMGASDDMVCVLSGVWW
jgi:hypothetical protein